jgi:hypothetical protein
MAFEQGFGQMAHSALANKFPELVERVVTFKVLSSDIDNGSGVGAFIVSLDGDALHVPVVLANNQVKPLEVMYYPKKDIFLPLDKNWVDELSRSTLDELGAGVEAPKTLEPDADIRNLVVPPTTGRYAYASANDLPGEKLARFLDEAPNYVKMAFAKVLERNKKVLKFAFENYDNKMLLTAIRPTRTKTAAAQPVVEFLTPDNSADDFRKHFGKEASKAWQEAVKHGFVVRDARATANTPVETQERMVRTTAQEPGFYEIWMSDGTTKKAIVIPNPQTLHSTLYAGVRGDIRRYPDQYRKHVKKQQAKTLHGVNEDQMCTTPGSGASDDGFQIPDGHKEYILFTEDEKIIRTSRRPVGRLIHASDIKGETFSKVLDDSVMPVGKGLGIFVRFKAGRLQGTEPADVLEVTTDSKGVRRMKTYGNTLVTDPNNPTNVIVAPTGGNVTYVPGGFKFLKGEYGDDNVLQGADDTLTYVRELQKTGALRVRLQNDGNGGYTISGLPEHYTKMSALQCLVRDLDLRAGDAEKLLNKTAAARIHEFYLVNPEQMKKFASWAKTAQGAPMAPPPPPDAQGGMPPEMAGGMPPEMAGGMPPEMAGGMPPEMAGGMPPPEMMAPPPPPPPNPVEIAAAEVGADLAGQAADVARQLAEKQRDLANQLSAIDAVKQRATQIAAEQAGGMPPSGPQGPVPQQPGSAEEMAAGVPPGVGADPAGGMPPQMAGGAPGAQPGMPPEMAGGAPGGGVPAPGPSGIPGVPPGGVEEAQAAEQLAGQAGPSMSQAAELNDPEAFEATAIGSMATNSDLSETVSNYVPSLENALDSLGRVMLSLWMREHELRPELGEQDFSDLERRLRSVFNNLGSVILKINQTALTTREKDEVDNA